MLLCFCMFTGFQCLDAPLCSSAFHWKYLEIWTSTVFFGNVHMILLQRFPFFLFYRSSWGYFWIDSQAAVLAPPLKSEKKVRSVLDRLVGEKDKYVLLIKMLILFSEICWEWLFMSRHFPFQLILESGWWRCHGRFNWGWHWTSSIRLTNNKSFRIAYVLLLSIWRCDGQAFEFFCE